MKKRTALLCLFVACLAVTVCAKPSPEYEESGYDEYSEKHKTHYIGSSYKKYDSDEDSYKDDSYSGRHRHGGSYERDSYEADHPHQYKHRHEKDSYEVDSSYKYRGKDSGDDYSSKSGEDSSEGYSGDEDSSGKKDMKVVWADNMKLAPTTGADTDKQTYTNQIFIRWVEVPEDVEEFFENAGVGLLWVADIDHDFSVYAARDVDNANRFMTGINAILDANADEDKSSGAYKYGPLSDPELQDKINEYIDSVFGEAVGGLFAATPANIPTECSRSQPESCPTDLYGLNLIKAPAVWNALPGIVNEEPSERVMVLDTGVRATHIDLAVNLVPNLSADFNNPQLQANPPTDTNGHGTHVSGTVFGAWDNGATTAVGVVGRARAISCGCGVFFREACVARCLEYARSTRTRVINMSFFIGKFATLYPSGGPVRTMLERFCEDEDGLVVVAAGNDNQEVVERLPGGGQIRTYPQAFAADFAGTRIPKCVLNVASVNRNGVLSAFSNYGPLVRVAAPGEEIKSAGIASDTATQQLQGTSMAAPHVTGAATLLFNAFPGSSRDRVYDCIVNTTTRPVLPNPTVAKAKPVNGGILDLQAAYQCMRTSGACPTNGLPACVNARSGQAVPNCDTNQFFCRPLTNRLVCQYRFRDEGALCDASNSSRTAATQEFEGVTSAELMAAGLEDTYPTIDVATADSEESVQASIMNSRNATQKVADRAAAAARRAANRNATQTAKAARRANSNTNAPTTTPRNAGRNGRARGPKLLSCGTCRARQCVAQETKWCKRQQQPVAE